MVFFTVSEFVRVSLSGRFWRETRRAALHTGSQTRLGKRGHGVVLAAEPLRHAATENEPTEVSPTRLPDTHTQQMCFHNPLKQIPCENRSGILRRR